MSTSGETKNQQVEILIAEDSPTQAEQLKYLLEKHNFLVSVANNGEEALALLRQHKPAIVISDIMMPRMDGYELCRQIKADEKLRDIPVVLLTALADPKDVMSGLECGADNFVTKPYNEDYLFARIQYLLANENLHETTRVQVGLEVTFAGRKYFITSDRLQVLNLLLSTYETAVQKNNELTKVKDELRVLNEQLEQKVKERTAALALEIEEHKRTEEELRIAEGNFRNSMENSPLGIRIVTAEGELLYANKAILEILSYKSFEELKATPISKLYTPESYAQHLERIEKRKLGKATPSSYEVGIVCKDRQIRHLVASRKQVVWNGEIRFQTIYQDITEGRQAEDKIRQTAEEWRTTFDSITDLVSIHNKDFKLIRVNKAFADSLNMKPEELIGKTCYQMIHGTTEPVSNCPHMQTLKTKEPARSEFFEPHLGIHLEVATSPIFNDKGEVVASVHVARDITERKKMEEQLIITDRLASIGQLASGIAHELNNPLTSVIGFSDLLLERDLPADVKEDLETINREAKRTAQVVKGLLTFARKQGTEKGSVDINSIIQGILQLRSYEQRVSNIEVSARLAADLPQIIGNGGQLQQVFINIIVNAEQAMLEAHGRGALTITTERVGDIIRASITDDGPGISLESMKKLFTPFFTTKEVGKGTGLGLSICHGIVTEHGGKIYAESEPGKGATFIVELPITSAGNKEKEEYNEHS